MVEHHLNEFRTGDELRELVREIAKTNENSESKAQQKFKKELLDF